MFEPNPLDHVDRVIEMIQNGSLLGGTPEQYAKAIREALGSDAMLSRLVSDARIESEAVYRSYLAELARRLEPHN